MSNKRLQAEIINRFSVSPEQADKLIVEAGARAAVKSAVVASTRGVRAAPDEDYAENPGAWREEVQKRMQAVEIIEEGAEHLKKLQKLAKRIVEAEQKLIAKKTAQINNKQEDWWDFQYSGWALGGREMFAQCLCDILRGLDEQKLSKHIMDKIGFKRSIPIDEDEIAPLIPQGIKPGDIIPAYEEVEAPPADAEDVEAMLVQGAKKRVVKAGNYKSVFKELQGLVRTGAKSKAATKEMHKIVKEAEKEVAPLTPKDKKMVQQWVRSAFTSTASILSKGKIKNLKDIKDELTVVSVNTEPRGGFENDIGHRMSTRIGHAVSLLIFAGAEDWLAAQGASANIAIAMSTEARELLLYTQNDGDIYRRRVTPIEKNLAKKVEKGTYDHAKAWKIWMYALEDGAKKYVKEMGSSGDKWSDMFSKKDRIEAAKQWADEWYEENKSEAEGEAQAAGHYYLYSGVRTSGGKFGSGSKDQWTFYLAQPVSSVEEGLKLARSKKLFGGPGRSADVMSSPLKSPPKKFEGTRQEFAKKLKGGFEGGIGPSLA